MTYSPLSRPAASTYYYLGHFCFAIGWLRTHYDDLLSQEEINFIEEFSVLPQCSQALLVRLVMRKGPLFRTSKICYPEIGDIAIAVAPLVELEWIDPEPRLTAAEFARLLTRAEIKKRFPELSSTSKARAIVLLNDRDRDLDPTLHCFEDWYPGSSERVYHVVAATLCTRFRLLFFGNFRQEWAEFVLTDLGIFRYEEVHLSSHSRAFETRQDIEDFFLLYECRRRLHAKEPLGQVLDVMPRTILRHEWLESRRAKLLFEIARRHESLGEPANALPLYRESTYPEARLRTVRVLETQGRDPEALASAHAALSQPQGEAEEQRLARIVRRLEQRQGLPVIKSRPAALPERLDLVVARPQPGESVEHLVRKQLEAPNRAVYYVENSLINSLFGLLCWDAIFAPVRGAFFHAFQSGPMDLHSRQFRIRRRALIERCLGLLDSDAYRSVIEDTARRKCGIQSPFVSWGMLTSDLLTLALACIPASHLRLYFERLLANVAENRTGLPDLVQFWAAERRYRMIEVKGPGDRLQDNQRRWIDYCLKHELPVAVCRVRWLEPPLVRAEKPRDTVVL